MDARDPAGARSEPAAAARTAAAAPARAGRTRFLADRGEPGGGHRGRARRARRRAARGDRARGRRPRAARAGCDAVAASLLPAAVAEVLGPAGMRLGSGAGTVSFAARCVFDGRVVPHLVVQTPEGPVTVLVLSHRTVARPVRFDEQGYAGIVLPAPRGSIAVVGQDVRRPRRHRAAGLRRRGLRRLAARSLPGEQRDARTRPWPPSASAACSGGRIRRRSSANCQGGLIVTSPEPFSPARESSGCTHSSATSTRFAPASTIRRCSRAATDAQLDRVPGHQHALRPARRGGQRAPPRRASKSASCSS